MVGQFFIRECIVSETLVEALKVLSREVGQYSSRPQREQRESRPRGLLLEGRPRPLDMPQPEPWLLTGAGEI